MNFTLFATWSDLLDYVDSGRPLFYQAPLDYRPVLVDATIRDDDTLRVRPPSYTGADPFIANKDHLNRFKRPLHRSTLKSSPDNQT